MTMTSDWWNIFCRFAVTGPVTSHYHIFLGKLLLWGVAVATITFWCPLIVGFKLLVKYSLYFHTPLLADTYYFHPFFFTCNIIDFSNIYQVNWIYKLKHNYIISYLNWHDSKFINLEFLKFLICIIRDINY